MSLNRVYQLIVDDCPDFIPVNQLVFKHSVKENAAFALIELPITRKISFSEDDTDYVLDSHHLSFYEQIDLRNPCLSEYHYTAIFKDKNNNEYQSHIYYDQHDQLTTSPHFNRLENDEYKAQTITKNFSGLLSQLAQTYSEEYLKKIREHHAKKVEKLQGDYVTSENKLENLSENEEFDKGQYLNKLEISIDLLNNLIKYSSIPSYPAILSLLQKIKAALFSNASTKQALEIVIEEATPTPSTTAILSPDISAKPTPKPTIKSLLDNAKKIQTDFSIGNISDFINHYINVNELLLIIYDNEFVATADDLRVIKKLNTKVTNQGVKLLQKALLSKDFDSANKLRKFTPDLPDLTTKAALACNNASLLKFLLENGNIAINTFIVNDELTPIAFCFHNSSEKSTKKEVFDVLLEAGANVMAEAKDGFPIACHIIKVPGHPLCASLASLIVQSKFWRVLATLLRSHLAEHPELKNDINEYEILANQKQPDLSRITSFNTKQMLQHQATIAKILTTEQKSLLQDPEIIKNQNLIATLSVQLSAKLNAKQRLALKSTAMSQLENLDNYGFDKDYVIACQKKQIESLEIQIKLMPIIIRKNKGYKNRQQLNQDQRLYKELETKLNKITKELNDIEEKNYDVQQEKKGWIVIRTAADIERVFPGSSGTKEETTANQGLFSTSSASSAVSSQSNELNETPSNNLSQ